MSLPDPVVTGGAPAGARLTIVRPGEGHAGGLAPGVGVVLKVGGEDTGGSVAIVEHPFVVGAIVPPHVHLHEDEISIVVEGRMGFRSGDDEVVLERGAYIVKPRNQVHTMWNAGDVPARVIEVIAPAGFEAFFRELTALTAGGPPDPAAVMALGDRFYRVPGRPDWLPDVVARYGLTPPPGG